MPNSSNVRSVTTADGEVVYGSVASVDVYNIDHMSILVNGQNIEISGLSAETPVYVYNLNGTVGATGKGNCSFSLPGKNIYVLKADAKVQKIVL